MNDYRSSNGWLQGCVFPDKLERLERSSIKELRAESVSQRLLLYRLAGLSPVSLNKYSTFNLIKISFIIPNHGDKVNLFILRKSWRIRTYQHTKKTIDHHLLNKWWQYSVCRPSGSSVIETPSKPCHSTLQVFPLNKLLSGPCWWSAILNDKQIDLQCWIKPGRAP